VTTKKRHDESTGDRLIEESPESKPFELLINIKNLDAPVKRSTATTPHRLPVLTFLHTTNHPILLSGFSDWEFELPQWSCRGTEDFVAAHFFGNIFFYMSESSFTGRQTQPQEVRKRIPI
jgi:hypothetical protein